MKHADTCGFWPRAAAEGLILLVACVTPWVIGGVDAASEFFLSVAIGVAGILAALWGRNGVCWRVLVSLPSVGLAGLVGLGLIQVMPMPVNLYAALDPAGAARRAELLPSTPERLPTDAGPPINLPPARLSVDAGLTRDTLARVATIWVLFQATCALGIGHAGLRRLGWATAINGSFLGLYALTQQLGHGNREHLVDSINIFLGPFICRSHLAEYMNMGFGFILGVVLGGGMRRDGASRYPRLLGVYVTALLVLAILTSQSRGGFVTMLIAAVLTVSAVRDRSRGYWGVVCATAGLVALLLVFVGTSSPYAQRLWTLTDPLNDGLSGRMEIWATAIKVWLAQPLFGSGLGTFVAASAPFLPREFGSVFFHAENQYLEILTEGGLLGLSLLVVCLVGVARGAILAIRGASSNAERATTLGSACGVLAVFIHNGADFGMTLPGVAIPLVVFCAFLHQAGTSSRMLCRAGWKSRAVTAVVIAVIGVVVADRSWRRASAEALVVSVGLPVSHSEKPIVEPPDLTRAELARARTALQQALRRCPDWAEGYLRLGVIEVAGYRSVAEEWVSEEVSDASERAAFCDPLWLVSLAHEAKVDAVTLLDHEPIRRHLLPAARCFLLARRCCMNLAVAQAELATLSPLFEPGDPTAVYVRRSLATAGPDLGPLWLAGSAAARTGDLALACRCWRQALAGGDANWELIADSAVEVLSPERILEEVLPPGRAQLALDFANRLYAAPEAREHRDRFLRAAAEWAPHEPGLTAAGHLHLAAQAYARLGERTAALERMRAALDLEPQQLAWRGEFVGWLLSWGDAKLAHEQARTAAVISPGSPTVARLLEQTAEAIARGPARPQLPEPESGR